MKLNINVAEAVEDLYITPVAWDPSGKRNTVLYYECKEFPPYLNRQLAANFERPYSVYFGPWHNRLSGFLRRACTDQIYFFRKLWYLCLKKALLTTQFVLTHHCYLRYWRRIYDTYYPIKAVQIFTDSFWVNKQLLVQDADRLQVYLQQRVNDYIEMVRQGKQSSRIVQFNYSKTMIDEYEAWASCQKAKGYEIVFLAELET